MEGFTPEQKNSFETTRVDDVEKARVMAEASDPHRTQIEEEKKINSRT